MTKENWNTVSAVATAIAASVTALMAWYTRKSLLQNERQHQDNLRPILVLAPPEGVESSDRSGLLTFTSESGKHKLSLAAELRNVGTGPAVNPKMHLRVMGIEGYGFTKCLSPVQAGKTLRELRDVRSVTLEASPSDSYNSTDHALAAGTLWQLVLEYEDVFGRRFHTIHSKDAALPWTIYGTGSAPTMRIDAETKNG